MKRWGIVITTFYSIVVAILLLPLIALLTHKHPSASTLLNMYQFGFSWIWLGVLVGGQALLLFLSVDTSWRKRKPRQHIGLTAALAGLLTGILAFSAVVSLVIATRSPLFDGIGIATLGACTAGLWIGWGVLFCLYARGSPEPAVLLTSWLLRASILELLIAIPAHIVVRQRGDCTEPIVTAYGTVTGIAIMLLSFGPGVLALYKKRLDAYSKRPGDTARAK